MKFPLALVILAASLLAGCATTHSFRVDAIQNPQAPAARSFVIVPADPEVGPQDLRFMEAAGYAEAALATQGFFRVDDLGQADMVVALDASVGPPMSASRTISEPLYATYGGYHREVIRPVRGKDGRVRYVSTMIWDPPYHSYAGTYNRTENITVYQKRFAMTAFETGGDIENLPQLWSVVVTNVSTSNDLRGYLPMLAAAAAPYIGTDTGSQVTVRLTEDDERVQVIRQAL